jgi:hypothetical protein
MGVPPLSVQHFQGARIDQQLLGKGLVGLQNAQARALAGLQQASGSRGASSRQVVGQD